MPLNLSELTTRKGTQRHRPIVQWVWDDDLTEARMNQQLEALDATSFGGVCIQPMPDDFRPKDFRRRMKTPYLSDAFFEMIRQAVTRASELGLLVWLYDEGGWPSGQACGRVLQGHPELEGKTLVQEAGRFIVERTGLPDALKRAAMDRFMQLTHEGYRAVVGEHFGKTIEAMFTDELKLPGHLGTDRIPWSDDMAQQFQAYAGYELEPVLGMLFEGSLARKHPANQVLKVRSDYARLCVNLFNERYIKPQQDWCHQHNLIFTGHLAGEHDLARHPAIFGDYMAVMRHFDMPGVDTIWRQIWHGHTADFPLLGGSARAVNQRKFAMSETGAVYGRDMTAASLKWLCDQQIIRGINRFTLMNLPVSGDDEANISALETQGLPWLAHEPWARHTALLSTLASQGKLQNSAAVLYPADDLLGNRGDGQGTAAQAITHSLMTLPGGCAYVDEHALQSATLSTINNITHMTCGDLTTTCLMIAGDSFVSASLAQTLKKLAQAGLKVVAVGEDLPYALDESQKRCRLDDVKNVELVSFAAFEKQPASFIPAASLMSLYRADTKQLRSMYRTGSDWQMLLVSNESDSPASITLTAQAQVHRFTVDTTLESLGSGKQGDVMELQPGEVQALVFGEIDATTLALQPAKNLQPATPEVSPWQVVEIAGKGQDEPAGVTRIESQPVGPWSSSLGQYFSGEITYQCKLTWTAEMGNKSAPFVLDLGKVEHTAQVYVNDKPVGCLAWSPYRFNLAKHLEAGVNMIKVIVANTSANHFWQPESIALRKTEGRWNIYNQRTVERCTPVLNGGLIGPVQWLTETD